MDVLWKNYWKSVRLSLIHIKSGMLFYKIRVQKGVKVMKFSEFIYKRIDLEETKKKIQEITEKLKHAQSVEEQVQAVYEMNDVKKEIATADSLVYIRYTINTKDEFYAKEREYNDHIGPMLEEEMQKYKDVYKRQGNVCVLFCAHIK